jgi:hypothetical protein
VAGGANFANLKSTKHQTLFKLLHLLHAGKPAAFPNTQDLVQLLEYSTCAALCYLACVLVLVYY